MPRGGVAQLGERLVCNQEAIGSIPFTSTILRSKSEGYTVLRATDGKPSFSLRAKDALRSSERRFDGCREERSRAVERASDGKPSFSLRAKDALRSSEASA
jgi:hypothetical protein